MDIELQKNYQALFNKIIENNTNLNIDDYLMKINKKELIKPFQNFELSDSTFLLFYDC